MQQSAVQKTIMLEGLSCPACEQKIEKSLKKLDGVIEVRVDYVHSTAVVRYKPGQISLDTIQEAIENAGYPVLHLDTTVSPAQEQSSYSSMFFIGLIIVGLYIIINNTVGFNFFPQVSSNMGYSLLFIAGLFTSFHCIAMCGGINLSQCIGDGKCENRAIYHKFKPSFLYNLGRVSSYTILGGIVGALGSLFTVSLQGKALISVIAGAFMVIMGLNMSGILPPLRRLMPRLPQSLTVKLESGKQGKTPFVVGVLNGFMPCGPLQAMQLHALGTGSFWAGAFSMFLFSLGTVPLMFAFGAFSSLLSSRFTKEMMKVSALLVIILGMIMGNRGFLLSGITVSDALLSPLGISQTQNNKAQRAVIKDGYQNVTTQLESGRYQPLILYAGVPVKWTIVAEKENLNGCNNEIIIPDYQQQQKLSVGENVIEFTPKRPGIITYTCWMGMISSKMTIE
ncbi:sulfite exporter TauE/SafE family protein [Dehalobacterium formicoaceticum]|uniref:urease accessory protein UreH domain-containing protein n=1 Tax=Dehalobacterium formicoaceticum TaxID=51515 RepID=UPI0031F5F3E2